jgi:hypothetical protein
MVSSLVSAMLTVEAALCIYAPPVERHHEGVQAALKQAALLREHVVVQVLLGRGHRDRPLQVLSLAGKADGEHLVTLQGMHAEWS